MVVFALRIARSCAEFAAKECSKPIPRGRNALLIEHVAQAARQAPRSASPGPLRFLHLLQERRSRRLLKILLLFVLFAISHPILVINRNRDIPLVHCRVSLHLSLTRNKRMI